MGLELRLGGQKSLTWSPSFERNPRMEEGDRSVNQLRTFHLPVSHSTALSSEQKKEALALMLRVLRATICQCIEWSIGH